MLFSAPLYPLSLLALLPSALAHFTLEYPPTRGFDEDLEPKFCGGFTIPSATRTPYSLDNTTISINSHHTLATVSVLISLESNPQTFADFSNGTAQAPYVKDFFQIPSGPACFFVDIATALSDQTIANGTEATLMVRYGGGDGDLFQCSDVLLLTNYTTPANESCAATDILTSDQASSVASVASMSKTATASSTASSSAASASSTSNTSDGATVLQAGGLLGALLSMTAAVALF